MTVMGVGLFPKGDTYVTKSDIFSSTWESRSPGEICHWQGATQFYLMNFHNVNKPLFGYELIFK